RDRSKANYAVSGRCRGEFRRTIMIQIRKIRPDERPGRKARICRIIFAYAAAGLALGACQPACAQGMATGGTSVPARPLPRGRKAPVARYADVAARAALPGINVSTAACVKQ